LAKESLGQPVFIRGRRGEWQ